MTARMRRLASDFEQVKKDFAGHKNIIVTPVGEEPPEKYHVTYFVNGIYLLEDGTIQPLGRHDIEIELHSEYPRYKPICRILTPIWHPNFRDGQICIGDIWGAGETLTDIIVNIGDMIQYKSWNSFSPLSADAAQWAMDNRHLFPVGNVDLFVADYASAKETVEIDLFNEAEENTVEENNSVAAEDDNKTVIMEEDSEISQIPVKPADENDFDITPEELAGIQYVPTAQRMQTVAQHNSGKSGGKVNIKTVLVKGLLWAFIGSLIGFLISEAVSLSSRESIIAGFMGHSALSEYYQYTNKADKAWDKGYAYFEDYCKKENIDPEREGAFITWYTSYASDAALALFDEYFEYDGRADEAFADSYYNEFNGDEDRIIDTIKSITRISTAVWAAIIALFIGLFLGVGEGIFYGSKEKALTYALIGAGVSLIIGFVSGYLAQLMYAEMLSDDPGDFAAALVRGLGWSIMGLGVGFAVGLIKPETKRILFCALGGMGGGFLGGFLFNYIFDAVPNNTVARGIAILIMGLLIGIGVGVLEQFAKQAWLKVIRGEFEGKEYLVFAGTTSIGNNSKNTIVLFKDKLVGPHHCDIRLEGNKYVLTDCGTPMGTVVNGNKTARHILRQGDTIAIGNSVLVFNTK